MKQTVVSKRVLSILLSLALLVSYLPTLYAVADPLTPGATVDPGTADSWENMMGTDADGNRYAGRVWVDKSVYRDGDTVTLNSRGEADSSFAVSLAEDEAFQIVFSALGSTMTTQSTFSSVGPMDVVLVLDDSTSMDDVVSGRTTRLEKLIEASNALLADLLTLEDVRVGIVAYNYNSIQVLPFGVYDNGVELRVRNDKYTFDERNNSDTGGTIQAFDQDGTLLYNNTSGYARGTNLQAGVNMGLSMLENASDTAGRMPVAIVLTDGAANTAVQNTFYRVDGQTPRSIFSSTTPTGVALATLLTAAHKKARVEDVYGVKPVIYGIGVDIESNSSANAMINPGAEKNGFNSSNSSSTITAAYKKYQDWLALKDKTNGKVEVTESYNGSYVFTFDHKYTDVTLEDIQQNIHYVDTYYPVTSAELSDTFEQIYEELSSGVFNPISSSSSVSGGTGVDDTPLIYVDFIGQYMEIKEIQSVHLFGASYGVTRRADGSYVVATATGTNPTTNESWNTAEDILITIVEEADGTQKLEIRIQQEILPIILEQVISETIGKENTTTITEFMQDPLRIYYTVGLDSDILQPNGKVDVSKIRGYEYIDDAGGTASFYSNRFGVMNPVAGDGTVAKGDAHVGFQPSPQNRYYYHQTNQGIFTKITDQNGKEVTIAENNEYGIVWNDAAYDLTWMSYDAYRNAKDTDTVYTYVTYYHPTPSATDPANAAEEITYLVYTEWKYLKESVAFYDAAAEAYLNNGSAVAQDQVASTVAAYRQSHPNAELYAVLGVGSRRTSRLHNMMVDKTTNATQTAVERYTPAYLEEKTIHNDNDVIVWLGNNGRLTVEIDTGIALTKAVTEAIGNPDDTYALTVTVPAGADADPVVVDANGKTVASQYSGNVLTVRVAAGETVYVSGIPGGTRCEIGEIVDGDYYIADKTDTVTVPLVSEAINGADQYVSAVVTNAPHKYGNLYITKEITSDHLVPDSVLNTAFTVSVNVGTALAGKTFTVEDSAHTAPYTETVGADGTMTFEIRARQTIEIFALPEGTVATVTEADPGSRFAVSYRTRNHSGEAEESDNGVVIPSNGSATAVVVNHYTPSPTSVDLDVVIDKTFADASVAAHLEGGSFRFLVQAFDTATDKWVDLTDETISYAANEYGTKTVTIADVLKNETYTQVGTYSYRVIEEKGSVTNVSYDRVVHTLDVVVTDNGGALVAKAVGDRTGEVQNTVGDDALDYVVGFTNTYETAPVSMDIVKVIDNRSGDPTVSAAGFKFRSMAVDQNGNPLNPNEPETAVNTIYSDAIGEARISGVYTKEQIGTHYYIVYEVDGDQAGWTYSAAQYFVTVVVEDSTGKLTADMTVVPYNDAAKQETAPVVTDHNRGQVYFTNVYDPQDASVDLDGAVRKELTGKTLEADQFTFYVYADGDRTTPILVGTNELNGDVLFVDFDQELTFTGVGTYAYDLVESIPAGAVYNAAIDRYVLDGMYYDPTIYDLVVEVHNDPASGRLVADYYFEDAIGNVVTYYNHYEPASTEYALGGQKTLVGRAPVAGEFEFELYEGSRLIETVANKADGSFRFGAIPYTAVGSYTYTIREKSGDVAGVRYDGVQVPITVTVTVTDQNGRLVASADRSNAEIRFENTYTAKAAQVTFNGTKELKGGTLADKDFAFLLYETDHTFSTAQGTLLATAENVNGTFRFDRSFASTGTHYFVVAEDLSDPQADVVYDRGQHRFSVTVRDSGDGQLRATVTDMDTGVSSAADAAVSADVGFVNAVFDEVTEKEVYLAGEITTEIDGKEVQAGDILTYFITYTNYTGENVVVDIMDTIPNHTSYVEGSASHGGTYAGTHINWVIHVPKGESVTVTFDVSVDETEAIVANVAQVRDGVNTYSTNEVVNHTIEEELKKEVFSPTDVSVNIDGKKVYAGDELLYKIHFTNTTGAAADIRIADRIPEHTAYIEGSADNDGVYENGVLLWDIRDVPAWATVTVTFKVMVDAHVGAATIENQATATDGTNRYETEWVTNYTVEDEVGKEVFHAEDPTVNIDGEEIRQGDRLVYVIRYRNTGLEKVTVTVTDTIPQYTVYVDGSADNGGVHQDGEITWTLEVEPDTEVCVSFTVEVALVTGAPITNRAVVLEGKNQYVTNEVVTATPDPSIPDPSTPDPSPPDPSTPAPASLEPTTPDPVIPGSPKTGETSHLPLLIALLVVSGGGLLGTMGGGAKRAKEKTDG